MKINVPVITIIRKAVPVIRKIANEAYKARQPDSDGGRKITREEWGDIALEVGLSIAEVVEDELVKANP